MTQANKLAINVLSHVPSKFGCSDSKKAGGGGWLRFRKILEISNGTGVKYHLVTVKSLQYPNVFFIPLTFISVIGTLIQTARAVKLREISLILCPIEDPWLIINAYLSSRITRRNFAVFMNSVPYFGLANMPVKIEDFKISYKALLQNTRVTGRLRVKGPFTAFLWYITFRMLKSSSTHIVCLNSLLAAELSKIDLKANVVPVYPGNGIDFDAISLVNRRITKYDAIYASGSLLPQKGLFDVVKIWRLVVKTQPNTKLAIAGKVNIEDVSVIEELNTLIYDFGLSQNVTIINDPISGMSQDELWTEMKCARIFLYPSRKDVWPLVIGEALACGLPVVAYDLAGVKYAYGVCPAVYLQDIDDIKKVAKTVIDILSNDSLIKELSCKARQYAENHSWLHVIELERKAYLASFASEN